MISLELRYATYFAPTSFGNSLVPQNVSEFYARSLKIQGFLVSEYWNEPSITRFHTEVSALIAESKIKYLEHRYEGLENAEWALLDVQT